MRALLLLVLAGCAKPAPPKEEPAPPPPVAAPSKSGIEGLGVSGSSDLKGALGTMPSIGPMPTHLKDFDPGPYDAGPSPKFELTISGITAVGVTDADAVLTKNRARFMVCADLASRQNPLFETETKLSFTVSADGVTDPKIVSGTGTTPVFEGCIKSRPRLMKFSGTGTVTLTVKVKPK